MEAPPVKILEVAITDGMKLTPHILKHGLIGGVQLNRVSAMVVQRNASLKMVAAKIAVTTPLDLPAKYALVATTAIPCWERLVCPANVLILTTITLLLVVLIREASSCANAKSGILGHAVTVVITDTLGIQIPYVFLVIAILWAALAIR